MKRILLTLTVIAAMALCTGCWGGAPEPTAAPTLAPTPTTAPTLAPTMSPEVTAGPVLPTEAQLRPRPLLRLAQRQRLPRPPALGIDDEALRKRDAGASLRNARGLSSGGMTCRAVL